MSDAIRLLVPTCQQPNRNRQSRSASGYRRLMQKWEYATAPLLVHATKAILDNWGEDGWELVSVLPGPNADSLVAYFKRPKAGS